jgi:hypothetical protein
MLEQLDRFKEVGCTEVTVSCSNIEDLRWVNENVAKRLCRREQE